MKGQENVLITIYSHDNIGKTKFCGRDFLNIKPFSLQEDFRPSLSVHVLVPHLVLTSHQFLIGI